MKPEVRAVLEEYQARFDREDEIVRNFSLDEYLEQRDAYLLGIGPDTGKFLNILIRSRRPKVIVEVGTSYGYSTLWMAEAAEAVGGRIISLELQSEKVDFAAGMMRKAGLESSVDFVVGDAVASLAALPTKVDFVLIDLWKELYITCLDVVYPKLNPGALIAADNILLPAHHAQYGAAYVAHVRSKAEMISGTVPIGSGVELSYFCPPPEC